MPRRTTGLATLETFLAKFDQLADAPRTVAKLRELVLDLAVQGTLVQRRTSDGDGHTLLKKLRTLPPERNSKSRSAPDFPVAPETSLEVPGHWALTTVENTTRQTGYFCDGDWVESKDQNPDGDVRLIQLADVGDGQYRDRSSRFMTKEAAARLNCSYLKAGDILVARMPDPLGRCCRFPGDKKPAVTVVDVCILRPNVTFFDPDFLVVAINSPRFRGLVAAQATGTTRSRISRSNLGVLPIPLPPLAEQKRIVAKVDELMALYDRLEVQLKTRDEKHATLARAALARFADAPTPANLELLFHDSFAISPADLRKTILTLAIQGHLVPQDPDDEPAVSLLQRIDAAPKRAMRTKAADDGEVEAPRESEPLLDLPSGWEWAPFRRLPSQASVGLDRGRSMQGPGKKFGYFKMNNIRNSGGVDLSDLSRIDATSEEVTTFTLADGDFLFNTRNSRELVGKTCVFRTSSIEPVLYNNNIIRARFIEGMSPDFLDTWFRSPEGSAELEKLKSNTTNVCAIYQGKLSGFPCPIPPAGEQRRIVAKVDQLMALVDKLEAQLTASRATADQLLSALVAELGSETTRQ